MIHGDRLMRRLLRWAWAILPSLIALATPWPLWPLPAGAAEPRPQVPDGATLPAGAPKLVIDTRGFTTRVNSLDFSPAGDVLAAAGSDKVVRLWEVASGRLLATLRGYDDDAGNGQCMVVRYSPDGRSLLVGVQDITTAGALRVYDTSHLGEIQALLPGHPNGGIGDLAFSADGRYLASAGIDGGIICWDWTHRRRIGDLAGSPNPAYFGFPTAIPLLVTYDAQGLHAFSARHARDVAQLTAVDQASLAPPDVFNQACAAARALIPALGQIERRLPGGGRPSLIRYCRPAEPGAAGHALLAGTSKQDGRDAYWVGLWTLDATLERLHDRHAALPSAVALTRDARTAASADDLGNVEVWDVPSGRLRHRLVGQGKPLYNAGFDSSGDRVVFGTQAHGPDRWKFNDYATPNQAFDLRLRTLSHRIPPVHGAPAERVGSRELRSRLNPASQGYTFTSLLNGRVESAYSLSPGVTPLSYGFLGTGRTGIENLLVIGSADNSLLGLDPSNIIRGRRFIGHSGSVYATGESPDGRFLASGSADRTLRIWSLGRVEDSGWPDFDTYSDGTVYFLKPGGHAERAGVRLGDTFTRIGGLDLGTVFDRMMAGKRDYRPGQRTEVELTRGGQPYVVPLELVPAGDFAIPLLSLFVAGDEWVLWTPSGYYDASPGGDRLIGWHVNRGRDRSARFYTAHQFRKVFFRPDVIDKILDVGDPARAVVLANQARPAETEALDLRRSSDILKVEPPHVAVTEPQSGVHTRHRSVPVHAVVTSQAGKPIGEVKVLLNGHPISGDLVAAGDTETTRRLTLDVDLMPGRNTISVLATDRKTRSSSRPQEIVVHRDDSGSGDHPKPRAFLLAVGISTYARPNVDRLNFAHTDAKTFAAAWSTQAGGLYADVETRLLLNEQCTVAGIRAGFRWLKDSVGPRDSAVVFIAAHGISREATGQYFIASHGVDLRDLESTTIADDELASFAAGLRCRRSLIFLDICHAGGIEKARRNPAESLRELASDEVGAVMFGACQPRESSQEDAAWGHGAFTKILLDTLRSPSRELAEDGSLSIDELTGPLKRRVPELTDDEQHPDISRPPAIDNFAFFALTPHPTTADPRPDRPLHGP